MPNWCYNRVRIDADSDQVEQLKEIHDIFDNHSDPFNQILPIPDFKNKLKFPIGWKDLKTLFSKNNLSRKECILLPFKYVKKIISL